MKNKENIITFFILLLVVFFIFGGFGMISFDSYNSSGMMGNFGYGFGGMWIFGFLFMTLISVALVLFILWLIKQLGEGK
ncbi:MAG: hypothetical protein AABW82_02265 [Nanoarchaeota archaeon]